MMTSADTPHMNPATNGYGTKRAELPAPTAPSTIWAIPASTTVAPAIAMMSSGPRVADGASTGSAASTAIIAARIIVVDARGPLPGCAAPPKNAATSWP